LVPALQGGCYDITWERSADLPSPMYHISAVLHDKKVYIMAGDAPDSDTYYHVYCYNLTTNQWEQLPPPGHYMGILQIIDDKLTVIGGADNVTNKITNKVSTHVTVNNSWTNYFPNLLRARSKPGVVSHSEYVIVAGGGEGGSDDIEILNTTQPSQWMMTSILLPEPMWDIYPTITDKKILIVGYSTSTGKIKRSYQLPVDKITTSTTPDPTSDYPVQWMKLPSAPHFSTRTIPNSHPPVIMSGYDPQYGPTSDVAMLNYSTNKWNKVSSLSSPRKGVALVSIDSDTILVLGGCTGGRGIAESKTHSITIVEKGRATLKYKK